MTFLVNHKFSDMQFSCNFHAFFGCLFWLSYKVSLTLAMILGVKGKVLEIDSQKILRPDPGLYSQYFLSYAIFCDSQIFAFVQNQRLKIGCLKICGSPKMS